MSWYGKSHQGNFDFYSSIPKSSPIPKEKSSEYKELDKKSQAIFQQLLDKIHGRIELMKLLKMYNIKWEQVGNTIVVVIGSNSYIIDNFENPVLKELKKT